MPQPKGSVSFPRIDEYGRVDLSVNLDGMRAAMQELGALLNRQIEAFTRSCQSMRGFHAQLVYLDEITPTDTRERALYLRQHRNTGPAKPRLDRRRR